jgi:hypothetical protein
MINMVLDHVCLPGFSHDAPSAKRIIENRRTSETALCTKVDIIKRVKLLECGHRCILSAD